MPDTTSPLALLAGPAFTWNGGDGTPVILTYSFAGNTDDGWSSFSDAQRVATREALAAWAAGGGLTFVEVPDLPGGSGIDLRFHMAMLEPWYTNGQASFAPDGDVVLNSRLYGMDSLAPGRLGYEVLLHEIGHALGLKHSFEGDITLPATLDTRDTSVMSYTRGTLGVAAAPRALDLAAIEALYGPVQPDAPLAWWDDTTQSIVITATEDSQSLRGTALADRLSGGQSLGGGAGDDHVAPAASAFLTADALADGGEGFDTLDIPFAARALPLTLEAKDSGMAGSLRFQNVEEVHFLDATWSWDASSALATVALMARLATGATPDAETLGRLLAAPDPAMAALALPATRLSGLTDQQVITMFYEEALGRPPEPEGLASWTALLHQPSGLAQVLAGIAGSDEAHAYGTVPEAGLWAIEPAAATVQQLYHAVLGRAAEDEGLAFYMARLESGDSQTTLATEIMHSTEFQQQRQGEDLVDTIYRLALGRPPEEEGATLWRGLLASGALDDLGFVLAVMGSPEFQARHPAADSILP